MAKKGLPKAKVVSHQKMTLGKVMKSPAEVFLKTADEILISVPG